MARMEIMSGSERRRRWSDEAKLRILAEADQPGVRIGDVARRHDIYPSQIRLWRQSFSYVGQPAMFLPVEITEEASATQAPDTPPTPALIEISLRNGRCLRVPADIELIRRLADVDSLGFPNRGESESLGQTGGLRCDQGFRCVKILMETISGGWRGRRRTRPR
ncbi:IS66-like element accessory protein TnpA [Agrobacterium vitis]|uniref:IS66-like element accessory protein TnpA n=1 Tax=Agrobacterium vitis TaxID=373 RepID=UPI001572D0C5|nr:transposase [Agrobacterium vitis]QZO06091.1 transposase [Agrobacterium vitis]UJL90413.1 transposase [Agrobacterium vitis]